MKRITLQDITIENFKGTTYRRFDFAGSDCSIYGDNAAGKSTINDAWHWLLFGKNRKGMTQFNIKPLGSDGKPKDRGVHTSVTANIEIYGDISQESYTMELKRVYYEKWSQKRGESEKVFDGNTTDFYIDGIPHQKNQYDLKIRQEIAPEDQFMILTSLYAFNEKLNMESRRKVLYDICGTKSDAELIALNPMLSDLAPVLGKYSIDDLKKKLQSERRTLNEVKAKIPARIDECSKVVADLKDIDFAEMHNQYKALADERERMSAELVRLENNSLVSEKRNELKSVQNELTDLENRNNVYRQSQVIPRDTSSDELYRLKLSNAKTAVRNLYYKKNELEEKVISFQRDVDRLRKEWTEIENRTLEQETTCPTCKRDFDASALEAARKDFENQKAVQQDKVTDKAVQVKEDIAIINNAITEIEKEIDEAEKILTDVEKSYVPVTREEPVIVNLSEYDSEKERLFEKMSSIRSEIAKLESDNNTIRTELREKLDKLRFESDRLNNQLANESVLANTKARIEELTNEERRLSSQLEEKDRMQDLCDQFVRFKVSFIEDSVNSRFRLARFKLFDTQVNGGLIECCDATYNGVPYDDINNGMAVNLGLDIIDTISEYYGVRVPLFIDNAESVTKIITIDTQTIKLTVSEKDKELRCENEKEKTDGTDSEKEKGFKYPAA